MKLKVNTIAYANGSRVPTDIEVLLDIDEETLARYLGQRALRNKRKMAMAVSKIIRATIRVLPPPSAGE